VRTYLVTYSGMTVPIASEVDREEAFAEAGEFLKRLRERHPNAFGEIIHHSPGHWEITDNDVLINDFNGNLYVEADE
jgi:hypothetical protein